MGGPLLVNHARFGEITAGQTFKVLTEGLSPVSVEYRYAQRSTTSMKNT